MLVGIVVVFLLCQAPLVIVHFLKSHYPNIIKTSNWVLYNSFTLFLTCINLSANLVLYCAFGQNFRETVKYMFGLIDHIHGQKSRRRHKNTFSSFRNHRSSRSSKNSKLNNDNTRMIIKTQDGCDQSDFDTKLSISNSNGKQR
jgi:hypothetical protein